MAEIDINQGIRWNKFSNEMDERIKIIDTNPVLDTISLVKAMTILAAVSVYLVVTDKSFFRKRRESSEMAQHPLAEKLNNPSSIIVNIPLLDN